MSGAKLVRKIVIQSKLKTQSPLRIGSGANEGLTDILILKDKQGQPFIPGTSMAGVLRSEIAAIYGEEAADKLFGLIDGRNANQSMLNISDVVLTSKGIIVRDGVAIDELTGVAKTGAKFDFEALERGAAGNVLLELTVRECDEAKPLAISYQHSAYSVNGDCYGEMAATIADLLTGGISVGSLTTKGYGKIAGAEAVAVYDFDFAQAKSAEQWLAYISDEKLPQAAYTGKAEAAKAAENFYLEVDCALQVHYWSVTLMLMRASRKMMIQNFLPYSLKAARIMSSPVQAGRVFCAAEPSKFCWRSQATTCRLHNADCRRFSALPMTVKSKAASAASCWWMKPIFLPRSCPLCAKHATVLTALPAARLTALFSARSLFGSKSVMRRQLP